MGSSPSGVALDERQIAVIAEFEISGPSSCLSLSDILNFEIDDAAFLIELQRYSGKALSRSGRRALGGDTVGVKNAVVAGAEKTLLVGLPVHPAAEMRAGRVECAQPSGVAFDQNFVAPEIEHGFQSASLKLVELAGEDAPCRRFEPLRQKKEQALDGE
jgi:hypothetical protein